MRQTKGDCGWMISHDNNDECAFLAMTCFMVALLKDGIVLDDAGEWGAFLFGGEVKHLTFN